MAIEFSGDPRTMTAISFARAAADDGEIGTEHLLWGLVGAAPEVERLLDGLDITPVVLAEVLRFRAGRWDGPDGAEQVDAEVTIAGEKRQPRLGSGAKAALMRCAEPRTPAELLAAVLADDRSRAVALIRDCGVEPAEVWADRAGVDRAEADRVGVDRAGADRAGADRVAAELRVVRDRLIGRQRYRGRGLRDKVLSYLVPVKINYAAAPVMWVSLESDEMAKARGGEPGTDDLLVAMLSTYEVATAYPHLMRAAEDAYGGSRALAAAGLDYYRLASAAGADLGADAVRVESLLRRGGGPWAPDTGELLRVLLAHEDTRAVRLLRRLEVDVPALRAL